MYQRESYDKDTWQAYVAALSETLRTYNHVYIVQIITGELRSLAKLEKQFPKKPIDDLRLRMVSLYLFMNGTDEDTLKWVLLEQITYLNRLDTEQR